LVGRSFELIFPGIEGFGGGVGGAYRLFPGIEGFGGGVGGACRVGIALLLFGTLVGGFIGTFDAAIRHGAGGGGNGIDGTTGCGPLPFGGGGKLFF
jgi:hypothetical protein